MNTPEKDGEEGSMVEMLRVYLGGDEWNPDMYKVSRGVQSICEELGFPVKIT